MLSIVLAVTLLTLLFASTLVWATRYAARTAREEGPGLMDRARLWAAAAPFGVILVLIGVSGVALLVEQGSGIDRLLSALASVPARLGLLLCALAALVSACLCGLVWRRGEATLGARLHLTAHVAGLCVLVGVLLVMSFGTA
ncbi:MAG: hypothetical protein M0R22_03740 [Dehalococcoidia bacterium]|nr:hypothetical protein [Dehalococcoidia bacterium]